MAKPGQKITAKQERACQVFIETGCKTSAYREAYNAGNMKPATINRRAFELFETEIVLARVEELQAEHRETHDVTVATLTEKLEDAREMAHSEGQAGAAVSACTAMAKLHGLLVDKTEDVTKPTADMTPTELEAELESIRTELVAMMTLDELQAEHIRVTAELRQIEVAQRGKAGDNVVPLTNSA